MVKKEFTVAVVGCGIVGGGTAKILTEQAGLLKKRTGIDFRLKYVCDLRFDRARELGLSEALFVTDFNAVCTDPEVDAVVELIGGKTLAKTVIETALQNGKQVVTANKALLASCGSELFALARANKSAVAFEASCVGGVPIIRALYDGLLANEITAFIGIINGTCNYILSAMISEKKDYDTVLKEAQKAGLAEADPTLDVTGVDSAHKLAILSSLAFSTDTDFEAIPVEGIDRLELFDINTADEMGYTIKLLAIAQQCADGLSLCVRPSFIKKDHPLAWVSGSFNAVSVYANNLGHSMYYGQGAGSLPTASAVVSDLISLALGYRETRFDALPLWPDRNQRLPQLPLDRYAGRYYLRLDVEDKTGVLAQVTEVLGRNQIGISEAVQKDPQPQRAVSLVLTTHRTTEGAVKRAVAELKQIPEIIKVITIAIVDEAK